MFIKSNHSITNMCITLIIILLIYWTEQLENQRSELRERIASYELGGAADIKVQFNAEKVNINLFGQMSAGKSAFMNSLNFALTGTDW